MAVAMLSVVSGLPWALAAPTAFCTYTSPAALKQNVASSVSLVLLAAEGVQDWQYADLAQTLAQRSSASYGVDVWSAACSVNASSAISALRGEEDVDAVVSFALQGLGKLPSFPAAGTGAQIVGGHSPTTANVVQNWTVGQTTTKVAGLLFLAASLARTHRDDLDFLPSLSLAGTNDGVARFSRTAAEAFYHGNGTNASVAVIQGASHASFITGPPSQMMLQRDLLPASNASVGDQVGQVVSPFFASLVQGSLSSEAAAAAQTALAQIASQTQAVVAPLLYALELEGSKYLREPCDSDFPTNPTCDYPQYPDASLLPTPIPKPDPMPSDTCVCGSPWVMREAQALVSTFTSTDPIIVGSSDVSSLPLIVTADSFHDVSDVHPFHLPHIWNECSDPSPTCTINVTTVTMPMYSDDAQDLALEPLGAFELRVKLKSRQALLEAAGFPDVNYNKTDGGNLTICRAINERLYNHIEDKIAKSMQSQTQFSESEPLSMIDDKVSSIGIEGPEWIKDAINLTRVVGADNSSFVEVSAWTFGTPNIDHGKAPYYVTAGYHYCKLLSPAWVADWIWTDGHRFHESLANQTS